MRRIWSSPAMPPPSRAQWRGGPSMERPVAAGGVERFSSEERTSSGARRFLLIRCDHLGDLLMATPAMRALRRRHPDARIDVMASPGAASALAGNTDVDRVL